jgi:hypothetical protein
MGTDYIGLDPIVINGEPTAHETRISARMTLRA